MSKSEGLKIGIKFTDDLVGDVGDKDAFTITGKEYKYINGPLITKEYKVDKVERYPIQRIWELGEPLELDSPGEISITDTKCYETVSGTTLTGTVQANAGDIVLATISHRSTFTVPSGWIKLYETTNVFGGFNQKMLFAVKKIDNTGSVSFNAIQSSAGRIYINLVSISNISNIEYASEYEKISHSIATQIVAKDKQIGEKLIWGASASLWATSNYGQWQVTPNDLQLLQLPSTTQPRQLNAIDLGDGQHLNRVFIPNAATGTEMVISAVRLIQEYSSLKTYTSQTISLSSDYRIRWQENKPQNTDILIEYTTGETQGQWQEVPNGDIINADTNLWIRATLSTEDATVTPTLRDLWLEEASAPQDKILITMDWWGRFNNAEGALTVEYDATKGNLSGQGGAVESFTEVFTPTGLKQTPNPGIEETITASPAQVVADFLKVEYIGGYAVESEKITAAPVTVTVELLHTSIVNP